MKENKVLALVLAFSIIAVLFTVSNRMNIEGENKGVDIVLDYNEAVKLANDSELKLEEWLEHFKKMGINYVALPEETLDSLLKKDEKSLSFEVFKNIKSNYGWEERYPKEFLTQIENVNDYDLVVEIWDDEVYSFVKEGIEERYPKDFMKTYDDGKRKIMVLSGTKEEALYVKNIDVITNRGKVSGKYELLYSSKLKDIGLGFDKKKIETIKKAGLEPSLRPLNFEKHSKKLIEAFEKELKENDIKQNFIVFGANQVLGFDGTSSNEILNFMEKNNMKPAMIESSVQREFIVQDGLEKLVTDMNYDAVRMFNMWSYIQARYKYYGYQGAEEIENAMYRAITERNIRAIYFRPFVDETKNEYVSDVEEYYRTFGSLKNRLKSHNMDLSGATTMKKNSVSLIMMILMGIGLPAAGILFLKKMIKINFILEMIMLFGGIACVVLGVMYAPSIMDKMMAMGSAVIFASIAATQLVSTIKTFIIKNKGKDIKLFEIIKNCTISFVFCIAIAIMGGLYIGAILSESRYLMEMDIFRGVKISQLIPLGVFVLYVMIEFGYQRDIESRPEYVKEARELLNTGIKIKHIVLGAIVMIAGYIYIARTGHESGVDPLEIEMIFRNFLENSLIARPRNKEIIAFPMAMISLYAGYRGYKWLGLSLSAIAAVGFASIPNTFSHLRTPVYISLARTAYAAIFGIIVGIIAIVIIDFAMKLFKKYVGVKI